MINYFKINLSKHNLKMYNYDLVCSFFNYIFISRWIENFYPFCTMNICYLNINTIKLLICSRCVHRRCILIFSFIVSEICVSKYFYNVIFLNFLKICKKYFESFSISEGSWKLIGQGKGKMQLALSHKINDNTKMVNLLLIKLD